MLLIVVSSCEVASLQLDQRMECRELLAAETDHKVARVLFAAPQQAKR